MIFIRIIWIFTGEFPDSPVLLDLKQGNKRETAISHSQNGLTTSVECFAENTPCNGKQLCKKDTDCGEWEIYSDHQAEPVSGNQQKGSPVENIEPTDKS